MRTLLRFLVLPCAAATVIALNASAIAAGGPGDSTANEAAAGKTDPHSDTSGPDEPTTHLKPPLPALHLTDAQKQTIRQAVAEKDTEVTFQLKATKPHKDFSPQLGEKIPPHLPTHALPSSLTQQLPMLADYKYMKVKGQVVIVNPMTRKVVDMFPEQG